jgi:hypothetical protein
MAAAAAAGEGDRPPRNRAAQELGDLPSKYHLKPPKKIHSYYRIASEMNEFPCIRAVIVIL